VALRFLLPWLLACFILPAAPRLDSPAAIEQKIRPIRADGVSWRKIAWKSCLLEGLTEAQRTGKPLILWCYIDRPVDDTRC
ncbi:uncharacterized protein METZ01_LOCUS309355, partial [marine metagenome]